MKVQIYTELILPTKTDTVVNQHKLSLVAVGSEREIKWLEKQLKKIGEQKK